MKTVHQRSTQQIALKNPLIFALFLFFYDLNSIRVVKMQHSIVVLAVSYSIFLKTMLFSFKTYVTPGCDLSIGMSFYKII